jgi:hypothetical protein
LSLFLPALKKLPPLSVVVYPDDQAVDSNGNSQTNINR